MTSFAMGLAKSVYRAIPSRPVRGVLFRAFCRLVRNRRVVATLDGMTFELDLGETIDVALFLNRYEPDVTQAIERFCRPGWTVLDIGANVGAHTLRLAKRAGPRGAVYAFEPTDYAYGKLKRNIARNGFANIRPFQVALSDENRAGGEFSGRSSWRTDGAHVPGRGLVDFRRLDDWCAENGVGKVDLVKIDVDGAEFPVIRGAASVLRRDRPMILIEAGAWHFRKEEENPLRVLSRLGYRFWDAGTLAEYPGPEAVAGALPERDEEMATSLNLIAAVDPPVPGPAPMPVDGAEWRARLGLSNFVNAYCQYRDIESLGGIRTVLVVGPGQGLGTQVLKWRGYDVTTIDVDGAFGPDVTGSVHEMPMFADGRFDAVVVSHVLEHLPEPLLDPALREIARVGRHALVYLPVHGRHVQLRFLPGFRNLDFSFILDVFNRFHKPDGVTPRYMSGQHYWEVGMRGFRVRDVARRLSPHFDVVDRYRNRDWNPSYNFVLKSRRGA